MPSQDGPGGDHERYSEAMGVSASEARRLIDQDYADWCAQRGLTGLPVKESPHAQRITMDEYGLKLAEVVSLRAACTRRQVGAVIIGPDKRILSTGYNGMPAGEVHCSDGGCPRGASDLPLLKRSAGNSGMSIPCRALHAERNAVDWCVEHEISLEGATIYCTHEPCPDCAELCAAYNLRVVWPW